VPFLGAGIRARTPGIFVALLAGVLGSCAEDATTGRCTRTIENNRGGAVSVAADDSNVYWVNESDGTVSKAPLKGGPTTLLAFGQDHRSRWRCPARSSSGSTRESSSARAR
jgi:hypothetical protein